MQGISPGACQTEINVRCVPLIVGHTVRAEEKITVVADFKFVLDEIMALIA